MTSTAPAPPLRPTAQHQQETLIGMDGIQEIIEAALYSVYLINAVPISLILIGPSGAGKSKVILQYQSSTGCHITTDVTSSGLQDILAKDIAGKIRYIIIPDFNLVLSHRHSTLQLTIANLLSMTSEGTIRIDDGRQNKETKHSPVGIISAVTRDIYATVGRKWVALGFARRFIPINYDYSLATRDKIQKSIAAGLTTMLQLAERKIHRPPEACNVEISEAYSQDLATYSHELANNIGWVAVPNKREPSKPKAWHTGKQMEFSPHVILRTVARAHALKSGRMIVGEEDINFTLKLISFTRFDRPVEL
jgi:hypothetical protein